MLMGFWSYVHADDDLDGGRIAQLARDVVANYRALSGEDDLELVLDRDALHWGDVWREKIDSALARVAFFVPILTPRYFKSPECRRELEFFLGRARSLGLSELLMPLLYIDFPDSHAESPVDSLVERVRSCQWMDWRDLRYKEKGSEGYRRAVSDLAAELLRRVQVSEQVDIVEAVATEEENEDGVLDRLAHLEEAMPRWTETLEGLKDAIERIGEMAGIAADDMNRGSRQGKALAARLSVARRLAQELESPVSDTERLVAAFIHDLNQIDSGFATLAEQGRLALDSEELTSEEYERFVDSVRQLSRAADEGLGSIESLVNAISPIESLSRDMRAPLRRLKSALVLMVQARDTTGRWLDLVGYAEATPEALDLN